MGASSLVRGILPRIYGGPPHPDGTASHTFTARNAASHPMGAPLSSESTDGMLCVLQMIRETDGARRGWEPDLRHPALDGVLRRCRKQGGG